MDGEFRGNNAYPLNSTVGVFGEIQEMGTVDANNKLKELSIENIKKDPLGVLNIWLKKPARMLFNTEFKSVLGRDNNFSDFSNKGIINPELIKILLLLFNIFIVGLTFFSMFFMKGNKIGSLFFLIIFYLIVIILPFSPDTRYKLAITPYFMILAAAGLTTIYGLIKR